MPAPEKNFPISKLAQDAISIWQYGVEAVTPKTLMEKKIHRDGNWLIVDEQFEYDLSAIGKLIIVGAGKASAAMATEFVHQHCRDLPNGQDNLYGWINAPAGAFAQQVAGLHLHEARPAGINAPTQLAIDGTQQILKLVASAAPNDLVISMISGGGSAILVSPQPGISLADKQAVAQCVAAAGGNIVQLNTVRRCISQVKGGGLARACQAGQLLSLIISDVLGDPLEIIASGPTVTDLRPDRTQAIDALKSLGLLQHPQLANVVRWLRKTETASKDPNSGTQVQNVILGNLADAVDAAGVRAVELGYRYSMHVARQSEGDVMEVASNALEQLNHLRDEPEIDCWISGGEPTVRLPDSDIGLGGRNQQLALAVLDQMRRSGWPEAHANTDIAFLSGGTDGEDGPTDAAGAWFDSNTLGRLSKMDLQPATYLRRADAYHFFQEVGGLLQTGPTGTNVCDLRVGLVRTHSS